MDEGEAVTARIAGTALALAHLVVAYVVLTTAGPGLPLAR